MAAYLTALSIKGENIDEIPHPPPECAPTVSSCSMIWMYWIVGTGGAAQTPQYLHHRFPGDCGGRCPGGKARKQGSILQSGAADVLEALGVKN